MAKPTNRQILTKGDDIYARKKIKSKNRLEEVKFDKEARSEYLTGFHKRKIQRQEHAKEKAKEIAHKEKLEERKRLREERKTNYESELQKFNQTMKKINNDDEDDEENDDWKTTNKITNDGDGSDSSEYSEWEGINDTDHVKRSILKRRQSFQDENGDTTFVHIEEMDSILSDTYVDLEQSAKVLKESMSRAKEAASRAEPERPSKPVKKFRYLTKKVRTMTRAKEKARKWKKQGGKQHKK